MSTSEAPEIVVEKPPWTPALMVIDMQNDFVYGSLAVPGAESIIDPINELIELPFKLKIATRDFHPDNHVSFAQTHQKPVFSKTPVYHPEDTEQAYAAQQIMWPIHCVAYTGGADFVPGLKTTFFDSVVHKGTHPKIESYSAFRDVWGKSETELPGLLAEAGVTDLYFVGLAGDYCVKYSAIDAIQYGYNAWIVKDAIRSTTTEEDLAFDESDRKDIKFTSMAEVKKLFPPKEPLN